MENIFVRTIKFVINIPKKTAILLIRLYQKTLSPDHGIIAPYTQAGCRYYPSCSVYTSQAIDRFGLITGGALGAWRILRCNPWSQGGVDEVPERKRYSNKNN